jgi:putative MATE family efflux protein
MNEADTEAEGDRFTRTGRGIVRGDLTSGPILRTLVVFTIPALAANLLQTVGGTINAIWIGQLLGTTAVAATANANTILFLLFGTVFGFGMATTIAVGRHFGARDLAAARRSLGAGIGFCTGLATLCAVLGWLFAPQVLHLMATPPDVQAAALDYLRITFISMPFLAASMLIGMGLRGAGDATTPLLSSMVTILIDISLNPVLILGLGPAPRLGIAGSALAGAIGAVGGNVLTLALVYGRDLPLRLKGRELRWLWPGRAELAYMLGKGLPMGAQSMLVMAAGMVFLGLVNREGILASAAYGASLQLWNYIQMPAFAAGQAVSSMVAQNIGARQHRRVTAITWVGLGVTEAMTAMLTAGLLLFDEPVLRLFLGADSPAVPLARHIQYICTWTYLLSGVMMVLFATMRAYGSVMLPLLIMFVTFYPVRLGFYALAHPVLGGEAVWWAYPVGSAAAVVLSGLAYRFGPWRTKRRQMMLAARG